MRIRDLGGALVGAVLFASPGPATGDATRVALLPIVVHSALTDSDYLSLGLADMLTSRLERYGSISVVQVGSVEAAAARETALAAAREAGAEYAIFGTFTHFGAGASLDVECAQVSAERANPRQVFIQSGAVGEIIPQLDGLAERIADYLIGDVPVIARPAEEPEASESNGDDLEDLLQRVEALEQAVYEGEAPGPEIVEPETAAEGDGFEPAEVAGAAPDTEPGEASDPLR